MLLGNGSDNYPKPETVGVFGQILPDVGWEAHLHAPNSPEYMPSTDGRMPVTYQSNVWGQWDNWDPDTRRVYGWAFPYGVPGGLRTWLDRAVYDVALGTRFPTLREQVLLAHRPGIGQIGADFWPHPRPDGKGVEVTYSRFPRTAQGGAGNKACTTHQLLYPGPDGAVPTVRYELVRENIQECEARMFLERLLTAKPCPLSDDLARECQAVLDERTRWHRLGYSWVFPDMTLAWPYSGWESRSARLFEAAEEAAKAASPLDAEQRKER
jgi:hypothetical protein